MEIKLKGRLTRAGLEKLRAGDAVLYSGVLYTARDAAHQRLHQLLALGEKPPFPIGGSIIYYAGPTPAHPGAVIGSAGPTTSGRMDAYAPELLDRGLVAMIGKGPRSTAVKDSIVRNGACYFAAVGGAAALISRCVTSCQTVCWEDLGPESVKRLTVEDMPLTVAVDTLGGDWYELGPKKYLRGLNSP